MKKNLKVKERAYICLVCINWGTSASWFSIVSFINPILLYLKLPIWLFGLVYSSGIKSHSTETFFFHFSNPFQLSLTLLLWQNPDPSDFRQFIIVEQVLRYIIHRVALLIGTTAKNYTVTHLDTKTTSINPSHISTDTISGYSWKYQTQNQCFSEASWSSPSSPKGSNLIFISLHSCVDGLLFLFQFYLLFFNCRALLCVLAY